MKQTHDDDNFNEFAIVRTKKFQAVCLLIILLIAFKPYITRSFEQLTGRCIEESAPSDPWPCNFTRLPFVKGVDYGFSDSVPWSKHIGPRLNFSWLPFNEGPHIIAG